MWKQPPVRILVNTGLYGHPPPPQHTWTHRVEGPGIRDPGNAPLINPTGPYPSPTYRSPLSPARLSSALDGFRLIQLGPNEWWPTRNPDKRLPGKHNFFYNIYTMLDQRRRRWADVV